MKPPRTEDADLPCTKAPAVYYPKPGDNQAARIARWLCARCPVKQRCAEWAIRHEAHGHWGGLSEDDRATIRARRGIVLQSPPSLPYPRRAS